MNGGTIITRIFIINLAPAPSLVSNFEFVSSNSSSFEAWTADMKQLMLILAETPTISLTLGFKYSLYTNTLIEPAMT